MSERSVVKSLFPMFVKLEGRQVLVVGAGIIGEQKIEGLLETGAQIRVVALGTSPKVQQWALAGRIVLDQRYFTPTDLDDVFLVVVATASRELNGLIFGEAERRGILCNVVDVPEQCHFYYPAVVRRGDLQIAVSTAGQSPSLAKRIRQQLERQYGPGYAQWVAKLGETRRRILASGLALERKKSLLQSLAGEQAFEAAIAADPTQGSRAA
jgi:precorrin-2 dehydrogenase / sirohydrochlorin ferrochelatase